MAKLFFFFMQGDIPPAGKLLHGSCNGGHMGHNPTFPTRDINQKKLQIIVIYKIFTSIFFTLGAIFLINVKLIGIVLGDLFGSLIFAKLLKCLKILLPCTDSR